MTKMATWGYVNTLINTTVGSPANKCPTKAQLLATGKVLIGGSYASNQLVKESDISIAKKEVNNITLTWARSGSYWVFTASAAKNVATAMYITVNYGQDSILGNFTIGIAQGQASGSVTRPYYSNKVNIDSISWTPLEDATYIYTVLL